MLKVANLQYFPLAPFARSIWSLMRLLIAETAVWPNFLLMIMFFALNGSKLFIINMDGAMRLDLSLHSPSASYHTTNKSNRT